MAAKNPTFKLPQGVMVPDGKIAGDTFQAMTTYKLGAGGDVELCEVDGEPIGSYKEDGDETPNPEAVDDTTQPMSLQERLMGSQMGQQE